MSGQDMRKLMEMAMGQDSVYVIMYGDKPVRAAMESKWANNYADEYRKVAVTDPSGPKEVVIIEVGLGPNKRIVGDRMAEY